MKSLLELIKALYGSKAISSTLGTRTNVVRLPTGKLQRYLSEDLNIEMASDNAALNAYKEMEQLIPEVAKMNDSERLIFEGNLRRLKNKLEASDLIPKQKVTKEGEVIQMETKEQVTGKGLESLVEEAGQTSPPGTLIGDIQSRINRLKNLTKEEGTTMQDVVGDFVSGQKGMLKLQDEGLVRATARQIMFNDIKSGKLKVSKEIQDIVSGKASGDPIDSFRTIYGEDALEQLDSLTPDLRQLRTEVDAEKLARSKFKFEPKLDRPKESYTPEEMEKILKEGEEEGTKGLDYLTGQEPPEKKADGGRIGFKAGSGKKILDLIVEANKKLKGKKSMETANPKTGEVTTPTEPVKVAKEPRTLGGLPIEERSANISDEIDKLRASGINSLENQKKLNRLNLEFIDSLDPRRANKSLDFRRKSLDTENKLIIKAEKEGLDFDTYEKLRQGLYGLGKQKTLNFIKTGKVDLETVKPPTTFEEVSSRYKDAAKAADEIFPDYNQPKTGASSLAEVMAEQKYGKVFDDLSGDKQQELYEEAYNYITSVNKLPKQSPAIIPEQVLEAEMNRVLNQYDKSMFIKNDQGMVDVTNPENVQKMALLLKRDHPEIYKRLEEGMTQTNILDDFDVTGRKPNATGGRVGFAEGTGDAPSITLDTHDKAPENKDKYPIKVGENLGLDIKGRMASGSSTPDPYTKIKTAERDFSVRGKYNVPGTNLSLTGGIGDIRFRENVDINAPEYNYKENIRNVMKVNPSSIGAEYKLGPNSLISGSRDSIDGRDTYNLGYKYGPVSIDYRDSPQGKDVMARLKMSFSKGGLGYLMGE